MMTRVQGWLKETAGKVISGLIIGFIAGGIYLYSNAETKADAVNREERLKKELKEDLTDRQIGIQRELDVIHKKVDRIDDKIDKLMEGASHGHRSD